MYKVVSIEHELQRRRQGTWEAEIPYTLGGKQYTVTKRVVNGEMETYSLTRPLGEMITTADGASELLEKIVLDVELGRESVPILYTPIYERIEDPNFPQVFEAKWIQYGVVVFLQHLEGDEIEFGHLAAEEGPIARIVTYAAGFEYTEDMVEYHRTFEMEALDRAFGEAYNALLNHIHFSPILTYNYQAANQTAAQGQAGESAALQVKKTITQGLADCAVAKRPASVLLASGARRFDIESALKELTIGGTVYPAIGGIETIIYYDGWSVQVGQKEYSYSGVNTNKAYLIRPKRGFKELIKHDLRIDADNADISRLVEQQIVGRARRGVYAAVENNVQELDLTIQQ